MRAQQFLDLLQQQGMLSDKLVENLRRQVDAAHTEFSAEAIAKQLVSKGRLTAEQAEQLLQEQPSPAADDDGDEDELTLDAPSEEDGLGLAPLEDELSLSPDDEPPAKRKKPAAKSASPASKRAPQPAATASLFDEELGGADSAGLQPLDDLLGDPLAGGGAALAGPLSGDALLGEAAAPGKRKGKRRGKRDKSKSQWDTPLMLVGGGLLAFLLLAGVMLLFFINRGGGDQLFDEADNFYRQGSYTQAIPNYDRFINDYPDHPSVSLARVHRGMSLLRQATDGASNFSRSLEVANQVIEEIEDEDEFPAARDELRALLPAIAQGLAEQAQQAEDAEQTQALVEQAREALVLVANTKYVPKSVRPVQRIEQINGILNVVTRDLERDAQQQAVLAQMDELAEAGETTEAYAVRRALIKTYPELRHDAALAAAAKSVAQAEARNVQVIDAPRAALADDHPSPLTAALALGDRRGETADADSDAASDTATVPVFFRVQGALYGLNRATGELLWRRWAGFETGAAPVRLGDEDLLAIDAVHHELVRLDGVSGKLRWRLPLEEPFAMPTVLGDQAFVATRAGKIYVVDPETGAAPRYAQLPQSLSVSPTPHPRADCLYQIGEHSNLYVLSASDLICQEVFYLGHAPGAAPLAPVVAGNTVLVAENWAANDATLHVLAADEQGLGLKKVQEIRLQGQVLTPPRVAGRQVVVATNRGEVVVFEISTASEGQPLIQIARRDPEPGEPMLRYLLLQDGRLWIGDRQLSHFAIHSASGRLVTRPIEQQDIGDAFDGPMQAAGALLIHVRRRAGVAGTAIAAIDMNGGGRVWQIELATPPAGEPMAKMVRRELSLVTASGALFRFDAAAIQARVQDRPLHAAAPSLSPAPLIRRVELEENQFVFLPEAGGSAYLSYAADEDATPTRWQALPEPLACRPASLGGLLLAPVESGQVLLLDPASGELQRAPFQPRLEPGVQMLWKTPGIVESGDQAIISDGRTKLYLIELKDEPTPHLAAAAVSDDLLQPITSPVAVLGQLALAIDASGRLVKYSLPDLQKVDELDLGGQAVWGPRRIGPLVMLVNELDELIAINAEGEVAWRGPLEHGPLAGAPLFDGQNYLCTARSGVLWRLDSQSGSTLAQVDLGQPLASGAVAFGPNLVVAAHDGTLLVVKLPEQE